GAARGDWRNPLSLTGHRGRRGEGQAVEVTGCQQGPRSWRGTHPPGGTRTAPVAVSGWSPSRFRGGRTYGGVLRLSPRGLAGLLRDHAFLGGRSLHRGRSRRGTPRMGGRDAAGV